MTIPEARCYFYPPPGWGAWNNRDSYPWGYHDGSGPSPYANEQHTIKKDGSLVFRLMIEKDADDWVPVGAEPKVLWPPHSGIYQVLMWKTGDTGGFPKQAFTYDAKSKTWAAKEHRDGKWITTGFAPDIEVVSEATDLTAETGDIDVPGLSGFRRVKVTNRTTTEEDVLITLKVVTYHHPDPEVILSTDPSTPG